MPLRIPSSRLGLGLPSLLSSLNASTTTSSSHSLTIIRSMASKTPPNRSAMSDILALGRAKPSSASSTTPPQRLNTESVLREANGRRDRAERLAATFDRSSTARQGEEYLKHMTRRWNVGDVYAPHDLSGDEMRKNKRARREPDLVDLYGLQPLDMYKNFNFLAHFMTPGGQIQHSNFTQLRPVNQRKVAKAIRRAIGMGLMPSVHRHPEILKYEFQNKSNHRAFQMLQKGKLKPGFV